ncbi:MAG: murein biosynthesis integral membrane protein MurJ [Spirochaetaceae bacterium]|nr:murein biosynthesis integral membrane protein MurJ [Spirochaetaceae bacterium]
MSDEVNAPAAAASGASKMLKEGGKLSLLTLVSRVLGLVREMTKAGFIGTGSLAEAFTVAFQIPNFMRRLFAENSITVAFIPTFSGYLQDKDDAKTREFLSATLTVLVVSVTATIALGIAATPWLVTLLFKSDPAETIVLTQLMFPFLGLVSLAALFQGILNSIGVFTPSALGPILFNLCFIAVPALVGGLAGNPARAMAVGVLVGGLVQAACQLPAVLRAGFRFGFIGLGRAFRNPGMRKVLALIAPTILGMAAYQLNDLVCTSIASSVKAAASIQYSMRLLELVLGVFAVSAGTVILPRLAAAARSGDWSEFSGSLDRVMRTMLLVTVPVALFSMTAGEDIVAVVYRRGEFGAESLAQTTATFFFHMMGLAFIALNRVVAPAFYARQDAKTPTWAGIAAFFVNSVLALALAAPMGGPGIALALSVSSAVNTLLLALALLRSDLPGIRAALAASGGYFLRLLGFSLVAAAPVYLLRPWMVAVAAGIGSPFLASLAVLLAESLLFGALGIGLLALSRDEVATSFLRGLSRRRRK